MMSYDDEMERLSSHMHAIARERDYWKQQAESMEAKLALVCEQLDTITRLL